MKTRIIAMYLPQYHYVEENSKFWGEGFTDWVTVKNAKPLFKNHIQPKIPLKGNYYDLKDETVLYKQVEIAKKYGVDGFCFYHYWFSDDKNIMTTPSENLLKNKNIDISFCFAWDNACWKRSWSNVLGNDWAPLYEGNNEYVKNRKQEILIPFVLGGKKEWKKHFDYLLPFFKDDRYIKLNDVPIFIVWNYTFEYEQMENYWNNLAKDSGLKGVRFIYKYSYTGNIPKHNKRFFYEPALSAWENIGQRIRRKICKFIHIGKGPSVYKYDKVWHSILKRANENNDTNIFFGCFVGYDDTPRRGEKGKMVENQNKEKFKDYFKRLLTISNNKNKEFVFITAWNEWSEGAYLEPDETNGYAYLKALKTAIDKCKSQKEG